MVIKRHIDFEVGGWGEFAGGPGVTRGYRGEVMAAGPMAYWRLGETSGTTVIDEVGNYHGTYVGGVSLNQGGRWRLTGTGGGINGTSGYINQGSATMLNGATACTVMFWLKYGAGVVSGFGPIIGKTLGEGWMITVNGESYYEPTKQRTLAFYFNQQTGTSGVLYGPSDLVRPGQWDFFACTFVGGVYADISER